MRYYIESCSLPGWRINHSPDTLLSFKMTKSCKTFLLAGVILTDLQKAFDTIHHNILLRKLSIIGSSDVGLKWF